MTTNKRHQVLRLYEVDGPTLIEFIRPSDIIDLKHTTILPGGFGVCTFKVNTSQIGFNQWRNDRLLARIKLQDASKTLFDGRLEIVSTEDTWVAALTFIGYWSNFTDGYFGSSKTYTSQRADQIVADILANQFDADTIQLSTTTQRMENTSTQLSTTFDQNVRFWDALISPSSGILQSQGASSAVVDLAVWEDQEVAVTNRSPNITPADWSTYIRSPMGVQQYRTRTDWRNISVSSKAQYGGTPSFTAFSTDTVRAALYGVERQNVIRAGPDANVTMATSVRDADLEAKRDLIQETDGLTVSRVYDNKGHERPPCWVRAGETIRLRDYTPGNADRIDQEQLFVIKETECDHVTGLLKLRFGESGDLAAIFQRNEIR